MSVVFVVSLVIAFAAGLLLRTRPLVVALVVIVVARYVLAVARWGFGGPDDDSALNYAWMALVLIGAPTVAAAALGALIARVAGRSRAAPGREP